VSRGKERNFCQAKQWLIGVEHRVVNNGHNILDLKYICVLNLYWMLFHLFCGAVDASLDGISRILHGVSSRMHAHMRRIPCKASWSQRIYTGETLDPLVERPQNHFVLTFIGCARSIILTGGLRLPLGLISFLISTSVPGPTSIMGDRPGATFVVRMLLLIVRGDTIAALIVIGTSRMPNVYMAVPYLQLSTDDGTLELVGVAKLSLSWSRDATNRYSPDVS